MRRLAAITVLAAAAVLAGCGGLKKGGLTPVGGEEGVKPPEDVRAAHDVVMRDIVFEPATISLEPGGKVTWTNRDKVIHTVTEGTELYNEFNSGDIQPGKSYTRRFTQKRKIGYRCTIHPNMEGTIFVGGGR